MMPFWVRPTNHHEMHAIPAEIEDATTKALCGKELHLRIRLRSPPGIPPECTECRTEVRAIRGLPERTWPDWRPLLRL